MTAYGLAAKTLMAHYRGVKVIIYGIRGHSECSGTSDSDSRFYLNYDCVQIIKLYHFYSVLSHKPT